MDVLAQPLELVRAIAEDGVSLLFGVPATYQRLLEYKTLSGRIALRRGRLRYLGVAGAPLDLSLKNRVEAEFGLPLLLDVWGAGGSFHQQVGITESIAQIDSE